MCRVWETEKLMWVWVELSVETTQDVEIIYLIYHCNLDMEYNLPREIIVPYCFSDTSDMRGSSSVNIILFCGLQSFYSSKLSSHSSANY
jgi:hypothetical protein